jgi:hypothetical protein
MVYIYILQLKDKKYYIGKTTNPKFRLYNHFNSNGSEWTKIYKPIKVVELIKNCDDYDEDKYTKIYMDKYGIDNVRGGSFVSVKLDKITINHLNQMSNGTNDKCFLCGNKGHFVKDCRKKSTHKYESYDDDIEECEEVWCCKYCDKEYETEMNCELHEKNCNTRNTKNKKGCCYRCGRKGHYSPQCYATKHMKGYYLIT